MVEWRAARLAKQVHSRGLGLVQNTFVCCGQAFSYNNETLVEKYIDGREVRLGHIEMENSDGMSLETLPNMAYLLNDIWQKTEAEYVRVGTAWPKSDDHEYIGSLDKDAEGGALRTKKKAFVYRTTELESQLLEDIGVEDERWQSIRAVNSLIWQSTSRRITIMSIRSKISTSWRRTVVAGSYFVDTQMFMDVVTCADLVKSHHVHGFKVRNNKLKEKYDMEWNMKLSHFRLTRPSCLRREPTTNSSQLLKTAMSVFEPCFMDPGKRNRLPTEVEAVPGPASTIVKCGSHHSEGMAYCLMYRGDVAPSRSSPRTSSRSTPRLRTESAARPRGK